MLKTVGTLYNISNCAFQCDYHHHSTIILIILLLSSLLYEPRVFYTPGAGLNNQATEEAKFLFSCQQKAFNLQNKLKGLKAGTRVGFLRDSGGFLHLYIDGEKQWVYARNAPSNCYVFFELLHVYYKVEITWYLFHAMLA